MNALKTVGWRILMPNGEPVAGMFFPKPIMDVETGEVVPNQQEAVLRTEAEEVISQVDARFAEQNSENLLFAKVQELRKALQDRITEVKTWRSIASQTSLREAYEWKLLYDMAIVLGIDVELAKQEYDHSLTQEEQASYIHAAVIEKIKRRTGNRFVRAWRVLTGKD
jgi:hypothetical protein